MTGFFAFLAARAVGAAPALRPRTPHRFETTNRPAHAAASTADPALSGERMTGPADAGTDSAAGDEVDSAPGTAPARSADADAFVEAAPRSQETGASQVEPSSPPVRSMRRDPDDGRDLARGPDAPAPMERSGPPRRRDLTDLGREAIGREPADDDRPAGPPTKNRPRSLSPVVAAAHDPVSAKPVPPDAAEVAATDAPRRSPVPVDDPASIGRTSPAATRASEERTEKQERPSPSHDRTAEEPEVDLAALLRVEVYGALAELGNVDAAEQPIVLSPGKREPAAQSGRATVRALGVSTSRLDSPLSAPDSARPAAPPTIKLHIDRVSVMRPAPPAPTGPPPPRPVVDHAAYMARRRGHG